MDEVSAIDAIALNFSTELNFTNRSMVFEENKFLK